MNVKEPPEIEYGFDCGDCADILFKLGNERYAVVEVETDIPEPGAYQALKYKVLQCAELGFEIKSPNVEAILVAWSIPESTKELCAKYNIRPVQIKL